MGVVGAASTATVSVLAKRLHRMDLKVTRWAVARVQGIAADIGVQSRGYRDGGQLKKFEVAYVSISSVCMGPRSRCTLVITTCFTFIDMLEIICSLYMFL
jgi:hypothetical protein